MKQKKARTDNKGTVQVSVILTDKDGARVRGNLVRSFKVSDVTVSQVAQEIELNFEKPDMYYLPGHEPK